MLVLLKKMLKSYIIDILEGPENKKKQSKNWKETKPSHRSSPDVVAKKNSLLMLLKLKSDNPVVNILVGAVQEKI
jgi:hypothetical protein